VPRAGHAPGPRRGEGGRRERDAATAGDAAALEVGYTVVHPAYRGRGLALALKLRTVAYAAPRYREIRTANRAGMILWVNGPFGGRQLSCSARATMMPSGPRT
jgi:GNAT superfamily N-acetyltransferase